MKQGHISTQSMEFADLPVIDWNLCISLANHKKEVAQELLSLVIQQLPADLALIQEAFEAGNYPELLRYVHKLHGALCYTGLPRLKHLMSTLESRLKQKIFDMNEIARMMAEMKLESQKVLESELPF